MTIEGGDATDTIPYDPKQSIFSFSLSKTEGKLILMEKIDILRKRLLYQSQHRGMKEMDVMLGGFAYQTLQKMTHEELLQFEDLLAFPDQDLYSWFFERTSIPENVPCELIKILDDFKKNR